MSVNNNLKLFFWNAQGITTYAKRMQLQHFIDEGQFDVVMLAETFLNPIHKFQLVGFTTYRNDRGSHGGGVTIATKNTIAHKLLGIIKPNVMENIAITVEINSRQVTLMSAYCPKFYKSAVPDIRKLTSCGNDYIIMGDFNAKHASWNCTKENFGGKRLYSEQICGNFLIHHPPTHTHFPHSGKMPSLIDLIITNSSQLISEVVAEVVAEDELSSDHCPITCSVVNGNTLPNPPTRKFNYKRADWDNYPSIVERRIDAIGAIESKEDVDAIMAEFSNILIEAALAAAIPTVVISEPQVKLSANTIEAIKTRNMVRRRWQRASATGEKSALKSLLNQWNNIIKDLCAQDRNSRWQSRMESLSTGSKKFWNITKSIRGKNQQSIDRL